MRKLVMFNRVTVDGYFSAPDGNLNWVVPDPEIDKEGARSIPDTDTALFGRKTYQIFESFWPRALENPSMASDPHRPGHQSPHMHDFAVGLNEMKKLVFSRTLSEARWHNSQIVREFDPGAIEAMKKEPGKTIIVFGSGSIVSALTAHGLIDEYHFIVNPVLLGSGRPLVNGIQKCLRLNLVEAKPYESGNVKLRYARM